ncbi:hypothetical protein IT411_01530 [Candidatus Peregrinibacteria bacterium]|nr:hypothetical protein [Candidatus Peregrinibacteria bacterium]
MKKKFNLQFNNIIAFFTGLLFTAIFFLILLKLLLMYGVYLGLGLSFFFSFWLKRRYHNQPLVIAFANGILTLDIITLIAGVIIMIVFFSAVQNLLN